MKVFKKDYTKNTFNFLKGLAIFSVVIAHTNVINNNSILLDEILSKIMGKVGLLGVPLFFSLSGYFFYSNSDSLSGFFKKKYKTIFLPWFFCSSIIFLITSTVGSVKVTFSILEYLKFILGYGSIYYYLTVLVIFYFCFHFFKKKTDAYFLLFSILNVIMILEVNNLTLYPYLNPLNWIMFFSLGIFLRKHNLFFKLEKYLKFNKFYISFVFVLFLIYVSFINKMNYNSYFDITSVLFEILGICFMISINIKCNWLKYIVSYLGEKSFTIYLVHLPVAGVINIIFNVYNIPFLIFKTFLVLLFCFIFIRFLEYINKSNKFSGIVLLLGIRN